MHLILTGATGLVGSGVLQQMIVIDKVTKVSILSRRPVPQAEGVSKVNVILHKDFSQYPPELLEQLKGAEGCVWALGIAYTDVDKQSVASAADIVACANDAKRIWENYCRVPPSSCKSIFFVIKSIQIRLRLR